MYKNGPFLIIMAALAWSTAGLFTRVVTTDIPTTLLWRSVFGGACVLAIFLYRQSKFDFRQALIFSRGEVVIAILSTSGMICFISSFFFTTIANVSFVYGTMPVMTYILALIFLRTRLALIASICCFTSTLGMIVITLGNSALDDYVGIALAAGMTFFMAALTVATKFFPQADVIKSTYLSAFLGAFVVAPFATYSMIPMQDYVWLGLYGIVNVGLGFGVYLLGLIEIPLAPVWAWLLFDEQSNGLILIGGTLIVVSAVVYVIKAENVETPQ